MTKFAEFNNDRVAELVTRARAATTLAERETVLDELIRIHDAAGGDEQAVGEARRGFLMALESAGADLTDERFSRFLVDYIEPADFVHMWWDNANQVLVYCEMLYSLQSPTETDAARIRSYVRHILRQALQQFEQRDEPEKMFQLLRLAPTTPDMMRDGELLRLRNRSYLYEMRRIRRNRRILYAFLLLQLVFIVIVFPFLFINAENGAIQHAIEEATDVNLEEERLQPELSYLDGLYWSLITATSIGYGDVTPETNMGKVIAVTLGVMGVITTGLIAGIILSWIVPRPLD